MTKENQEKPLGQRIRFKIEFALLMIRAGRIEEAAEMFEQALELADQVDA